MKYVCQDLTKVTGGILSQITLEELENSIVDTGQLAFILTEE